MEPCARSFAVHQPDDAGFERVAIKDNDGGIGRRAVHQHRVGRNFDAVGQGHIALLVSIVARGVDVPAGRHLRAGYLALLFECAEGPPATQCRYLGRDRPAAGFTRFDYLHRNDMRCGRPA